MWPFTKPKVNEDPVQNVTPLQFRQRQIARAVGRFYNTIRIMKDMDKVGAKWQVVDAMDKLKTQLRELKTQVSTETYNSMTTDLRIALRELKSYDRLVRKSRMV